MRTTLFGLAAVVAFMLFILNARAADVADSRDADHAALRALMAKVTMAVNQQDIGGLTECFTKRFAFTTVDQSVLTDTLTLKNYFNRMLKEKDSPVTGYKVTPKADVRTVFVDANTGYCHGTSDDVYTLRRNGRQVHMPCHWTATVVKENGAWKISTVHSGVNVMNNPVIDTLVAMSMWRSIPVAAGVGLLVGMGVGLLVAKRTRKSKGISIINQKEEGLR